MALRQTAPGGLEDAEVRGHDRIVRLALSGLVERPLGAGQVVAPAEAGGQTDMRVRGRQSAVDRRRELPFRPRAVT